MANLEAGMSSDAARALGGEYQVFLSFRGPDTRYGFTDFLYHGLVDAGIRVFRDEDELCVGEVIGGNLLHAINNSILYIPIFSQTYASSRWCLRELARIVDNVLNSEGKKSILPIFLDVEPEDVKLKTPLYSAALLEHANKFPDEVKDWRKALKEVDEIKGWNVKKDQSQAVIVKLVVEKVLEKLQTKQKPVTEHLLGLDDRVKDLTELLDVNHRDVRLIGIYGMGGIGKTTIAKVIFNQLSSQFGKCCSFLEDVRESSSTKKGIVQLQNKLLADVVGSLSANEVNNSEQGMRRIGEILSTKKVLVVLDDVDNKEHIKKLTGNFSLHLGSRLIITTRNTAILQVEGFKGEILPYEMLKMDYDVAIQLFSRLAFGRDLPLNEYHGLSNELVSSMGGLPLAIVVIGSLLNRKNQAFWEETLVRLRNIPDEEILKKLRISYDGLDEYQQQIFLDIACFFSNEKKTDAIYMWASCHFYPQRGIDVLTSRCLIKVLDNDKFWMHDQLIDLGRTIVHQESPSDLGRRSRLWIAEEALEIIRTEERKDKVQALRIDYPDGSIEITNEEFERLQNLRCLKLRNGTYVGDFAKCRSKLRWISWQPPLMDFRADDMHLDHLVVFKLGKNIFTDDSKAWNLTKRARNLKVLSLTECSCITTIPDFSKCLGLERLTLIRCYKLKRIERFIGDLQLLIHLEIKWCGHIIDLPEEVGALVKLKRLSLQGCTKLRQLPSSLGNLTSLVELDLSHTDIVNLPNSIEGLVKLESFLMCEMKMIKLPSSIGKLKSLRILRFSSMLTWVRSDDVWQLPSAIGMLENLEELDLSKRNDLKGEIPCAIGEMSSLRILNLECTSICGIPRTINSLHHLQMLNLSGCHGIYRLPELPTSLTNLRLESKSLLSVPNLSNLTNLVELLLSDGSEDTGKSNLITGYNLRQIGKLSRLKNLHLQLQNLPTPPELASLSHLKALTLCCLDLETLMQLPSSLRSLDLKCLSIKRTELLSSCLRLRNLSSLNFWNCKVEDIPLDGLPQLQYLFIECCKLFQRLSIPLELTELQNVVVLSCPELVEIRVMGLLKSLEFFYVDQCKSMRRIGELSHLKNLKELKIARCHVLTDVEGLNKLESLESLIVTNCTSLRRLIHASCTNIPANCLIEIRGCGDFINCTWIYPRAISLKRYREKIFLDTSNKMEYPFTILFQLFIKNPSVGIQYMEKNNVTPDSVTYKGLIADVKGFGYRVRRMWYKNRCRDDNRRMEIKSDEQVKEMVQLASKSGFIQLDVTAGVDRKREEEDGSNMMSIFDEFIRMRNHEDGAEWDDLDPDEMLRKERRMTLPKIGAESNEEVEQYERSCKATTEAEDQRDIFFESPEDLYFLCRSLF